MADDVDNANDRILEHAEGQARMIAEKAAEMPKGVEGVCGYCELFSKRLVGGHCAKCRTELRLP